MVERNWERPHLSASNEMFDHLFGDQKVRLMSLASRREQEPARALAAKYSWKVCSLREVPEPKRL